MQRGKSKKGKKITNMHTYENKAMKSLANQIRLKQKYFL